MPSIDFFISHSSLLRLPTAGGKMDSTAGQLDLTEKRLFFREIAMNAGFLQCRHSSSINFVLPLAHTVAFMNKFLIDNLKIHLAEN